MSVQAQVAMAIVWIVSLTVVAVDAHQDVVSQPWLPWLIPLALGCGAAASVLIVLVDRLVRRNGGRN
jgi:hypothetical protein